MTCHKLPFSELASSRRSGQHMTVNGFHWHGVHNITDAQWCGRCGHVNQLASASEDHICDHGRVQERTAREDAERRAALAQADLTAERQRRKKAEARRAADAAMQTQPPALIPAVQVGSYAGFTSGFAAIPWQRQRRQPHAGSCAWLQVP